MIFAASLVALVLLLFFIGIGWGVSLAKQHAEAQMNHIRREHAECVKALEARIKALTALAEYREARWGERPTHQPLPTLGERLKGPF